MNLYYVNFLGFCPIPSVEIKDSRRSIIYKLIYAVNHINMDNVVMIESSLCGYNNEETCVHISVRNKNDIDCINVKTLHKTEEDALEYAKMVYSDGVAETSLATLGMNPFDAKICFKSEMLSENEYYKYPFKDKLKEDFKFDISLFEDFDKKYTWKHPTDQLGAEMREELYRRLSRYLDQHDLSKIEIMINRDRMMQYCENYNVQDAIYMSTQFIVNDNDLERIVKTLSLGLNNDEIDHNYDNDIVLQNISLK